MDGGCAIAMHLVTAQVALAMAAAGCGGSPSLRWRSAPAGGASARGERAGRAGARRRWRGTTRRPPVPGRGTLCNPDHFGGRAAGVIRSLARLSLRSRVQALVDKTSRWGDDCWTASSTLSAEQGIAAVPAIAILLRSLVITCIGTRFAQFSITALLAIPPLCFSARMKAMAAESLHGGFPIAAPLPISEIAATAPIVPAFSLRRPLVARAPSTVREVPLRIIAVNCLVIDNDRFIARRSVRLRCCVPAADSE
jgi:hypothetical protein